MLTQPGGDHHANDGGKRIQRSICQPHGKGKLRRSQKRGRVEQVKDRFEIRYGRGFGQLDNDALHGLIPEWGCDQAAWLQLRNKFSGDGVVEYAGDGGNIDGEAGEHGSIIMSRTEVDMSTFILVAGALMILISLGLLAMVFMRSNQVNLTGKTEEKPEWMQSTPPAETIAATKEDDEGVTLFDHDEGEQVAAAFAEQIEDVLRAKASSDPYLKSFDIDFGTAADGGLEIWVNGEKYDGVASLPDEKLKQTLLQAVKEWNSGK